MKRLLLGLATPLLFSAAQAAADDLKAVASPIYDVGELAWARALNWPNYIAKDSSNSPATEIDGFKVEVVEDTEPGHRKVTKYLTSWSFHNFSEDYKNRAPLLLTITFYNKDGHVIDSYQEKSPRGYCTYNPSTQDQIAEPVIGKGNHLEDISTAVLSITYSAISEGSC